VVFVKNYGGRSSVGRVPDCDSGCRGFEPHRSPQNDNYGLLAQLVEQLTLNQRVVGSIPTQPTIYAKVAKLVYALDLGSCGATRESSSLSFRTNNNDVGKEEKVA
jgi:hypothetical protein